MCHSFRVQVRFMPKYMDILDTFKYSFLHRGVSPELNPTGLQVYMSFVLMKPRGREIVVPAFDMPDTVIPPNMEWGLFRNMGHSLEDTKTWGLFPLPFEPRVCLGMNHLILWGDDCHGDIYMVSHVIEMRSMLCVKSLTQTLGSMDGIRCNGKALCRGASVVHVLCHLIMHCITKTFMCLKRNELRQR